MGLAVFDIDGTLVAGPSTEKRFFWRLFRRGLLGPRRLAAFLFFNLRWLHRYGRHVAKKNKAYLAGMDLGRLQAEAADFVAAEVMPALHGPAVARLRRHVAAGETVVLLSGTLQPIADELARRLGADEAIASLCDRRDGRLTSGPPVRHPFGDAKRGFLDDLCRRYGRQPEEVAAYGDSGHDLVLLQAVGRPVAVRPDKALTAAALQRGWEILPDGGPDDVGDARRDTV